MNGRVTWRALVGVAAIGATVAGVFAQDVPAPQPKGEKPDAAAIVRQADAAMKAVGSLSFHVERMGVGSAARSPRLVAEVVMERPESKAQGKARRDGFSTWRFLVTGRSGDAAGDMPTVLAAGDGKTIRVRKDETKKVIEAGVPSAGLVLADSFGWAVRWAASWEAYLGSLAAEEVEEPPVRHEGVIAVGGEPCDVIYVDYSDVPSVDEMDAWWYLSQKDHLPRRIDVHTYDEEHGDGFSVLTITDLKTGATPAADAPGADAGRFALAVPEGYTVEKYQPAARERPQARGPRPAEDEGGGGAGRPEPAAGLKIGDAAPDFELKDPQGATHKLAQYRGKVVVLDFWATWCPPCRAAMPGVQRLHEKFKDRGVVVLGMNAMESGDPAAFMKTNKYTYGLLLKADAAAEAYGIQGIPTFYVIGKDGKIAFKEVGYGGEAGEKQIESVIEAELAK